MKPFYFFILLIVVSIFFSTEIFASSTDSLYQFTPASFKGGEEALSTLIEKNINLKNNTYKRVSEGHCNLLLKLSSKGSINNLWYLDLPDSCFFAEELALLLYYDSTNWQPSLFNNKPIDIEVELRVIFSFDQKSKYIKIKCTYFSKPYTSFESCLYNEAVKLQTEGRINDALKLYNEAIAIVPYDEDAIYNRGICKMKLSDTSGACNDWMLLQNSSKHIADKALSKYCNGVSNSQKQETGPLSKSEVMPEFQGGENTMLMYIGQQTNYPRYERTNGIQGTVYLTFIVLEDGSIENLKVLRGVNGGPCLALEASRVVLSMPKWKPGLQDGKPVKVSFQLPVRFTLK